MLAVIFAFLNVKKNDLQLERKEILKKQKDYLVGPAAQEFIDVIHKKDYANSRDRVAKALEILSRTLDANPEAIKHYEMCADLRDYINDMISYERMLEQAMLEQALHEMYGNKLPV